LPPGLVGNPLAASRCSAEQFNVSRGVVVEGVTISQNDCPDASAVGLVYVQQLEGLGGLVPAPLYNLVPAPGMPAQFGFQVLGAPFYIDTSLRSGSDFGVSAHLRNTSEAKRVTAATVTIWGAVSDQRHDRLRGHCDAGFSLGICPSGLPARAFLRLPTSCASPLLTTMSFDSWLNPGVFTSAGFSEPPLTGCDLPDFSPSIEARPSTDRADSPTGLHVELHFPQEAHEDPAGRSEADLRNAAVTLPEGLVVNPASAGGLEACSPGQVGLLSAVGQLPIRFNEAPAACPDAAKVATVSAETPLLDHPVPGGVYLARQQENPFNSLLALYIVLEDPGSGILVKLAGKVSPDPVTGRLTTVFTENPQLPVSAFKFDFFAGPRASLRTPTTCGAYNTTTVLRPWTYPASGPDATPADSFSVNGGPAGSCPSGALDPHLSAGLASPAAAVYSPFRLRLFRDDASGEFSTIDAQAPPGLLAKLRGIPYCSDGAIAQAAARSSLGQGAAEVASPSCSSDSRVGSVSAGAGAGPDPFYTGGSVYLAGPYRSAPLSLVAIVPALAGPFDLGVVVTRIALQVNPETAQVNAVSDPLPRILSGIPLDVRDIRVNLDRAGFTLAPTNCEPSLVKAAVVSPSGQNASRTQRFQVGGCRALRFSPRLSLRLKGGTRRSKHPALRAVLTARAGQANIGRASVALPHSEFLEQAHIRTICTRVQFAADACPKGSIYGRARAVTPLLDRPLEGPVYLRSSDHPLPDLVAALHGQVDIDLVGRIDSHQGGIRTSFEAVPDAPVSKFVLQMGGGKRGLLVNSRNICNHRNRVTVKMVGQNGRLHNFRPLLRDSCKKAKKHAKHRKAKKQKR
jgi:hypothetical protein